MRYLYFVGVKLGSATIFRASKTPEKSTHPQFLYCWGPYRTRKFAEKVAMFHNYRLTNTPKEKTPIIEAK